jgi:hypothetical protein
LDYRADPCALEQEDPMSPRIAYSAAQDDLFNPGRRDGFFSPAPQSEAALSAEMARLAYCRKEPDFGLDQERIQKILKIIGFECQFFESQNRPQGKGSHCFLAVGDHALKNGKLPWSHFGERTLGTRAIWSSMLILSWRDGQARARYTEVLPPR